MEIVISFSNIEIKNDLKMIFGLGSLLPVKYVRIRAYIFCQVYHVHSYIRSYVWTRSSRVLK